MSIPRSVAEVLREHVVLEVEAIDRMYLNVYVPHLQSVGAVVGYLRVHRGQRFASTTAVTPMTETFVRNIDQFINHESVDLVAFQKGFSAWITALMARNGLTPVATEPPELTPDRKSVV